MLPHRLTYGNAWFPVGGTVRKVWPVELLCHWWALAFKKAGHSPLALSLCFVVVVSVWGLLATAPVPCLSAATPHHSGHGLKL